MARKRAGKTTKRKDVIRVKKAAQMRDQMDHPTPEMQARANFELGKVTDETGQSVGFAYRRKPLIETMALKGGFSPDELAALRFYRTAFDRSERSPVKCCLNVSGSGRGTSGAAFGIFHATPAMLDAKRKLQYCEHGFGNLKDTMRGVVLMDKSFSEIAIDRFGSRIVKPPAYVDKEGHARGDHREKITPRSGRHRETVRQEFIVGLKVLTDTVRAMITTGSVEEIWVDPNADGTALIKRGIAAPAGRYRCWGDSALLDRVIAELRAQCGNDLSFKSATAAISAIKTVEDGRLRHLDPEELAA
ncbi:hypothetical protein ACKU27_13720 [Sphingobium yanoikuyae]|uniref:hypothetical protein n=1 Tax=Sphingobium yanoikuyae TaxID=13690 RepID=UPI003B90DA96